MIGGAFGRHDHRAEAISHLFEVLRVRAEPGYTGRCRRYGATCRNAGRKTPVAGCVRTRLSAIAINEYTAPIQAEILRSIGMPAMAKTADAVASD